MDKKVTQLGELKDTAWKGFFILVFGIAIMFTGFYSFFTFPFMFFVNIIGTMAGLFIAVRGWQLLDGAYDGICPYCGHEVEVLKKAKIFKCRHCQHKINRIGDTLEEFE